MILDYHMPTMDGRELALRIRKQLGAATPPMVMLSSKNKFWRGCL